MNGGEKRRAFCGPVCDNSVDLHCELLGRTRVGDRTSDEERMERLHAEGFPEEARAMVAYSVTGSQITFGRMFM